MNGSQMRSFLRTWGVFALVSALFASTRLWRLTEHSLRPDEIFSLQTARQDWIGLIHAAVRDVVHPPLFYALLKSWIAVGGDSEYWLRLLPVLIAALTPLPFLLLGRRLGIGWNAINLGVLLMAVNAYLVYFARDLRMYSLVPLLTVCSLWLMFRYKDGAPDDRKRWLPLFAVNVLLVYSHYFGWLIVAGEALILCLDDRRRVRAVLLSCAALLLLFIPWAGLVTRASLARGGLESSIGSFARPTLGDLGGYYVLLTGRLDSSALTALGIALTVAPVLCLAMRLARRRAPADTTDRAPLAFWSLALFATMPVLVVFLLSQVLPQSIWGTRMLVLSAAPYLLLVAMSLDALRPKWLRNLTVVAVVVYTAFAGMRGMLDTGDNDWRPLVRQMMASEPSRVPGVVVYAFGSMDEVIAFYAGEAGDRRFETRRIRDRRSIAGEHFWVAYRERNQPQLLDFLRDNGYRINEEFRDGYGGVLVSVRRIGPTAVG